MATQSPSSSIILPLLIRLAIAKAIAILWSFFVSIFAPNKGAPP